MRIIIVRHGDPDYVNDTLTERGEKEAALLADIIGKYNIDRAYVSPKGRAARTAQVCLERLGMEGTTYEWLREFEARISHPDNDDKICWDWNTDVWTSEPKYYDLNTWTDTDVMKAGNAKSEYDWVIGEFDKLLEENGYARDGMYYRAVNSNHDTIAFFCHFGVEVVLLSRLLNVSPMILWHGLCAAPTAITSIYTEERKKGIVSFRINEFGATPHLMIGGMEPSKRARFVECYEDQDEGFERK